MEESYETLRQKLVSKAKAGDVCFYSDIAPDLGMTTKTDHEHAEIGRILGEISKAEHTQGRPMLSAIVISKNENIPGPGFFTLARELGLYTSGNREPFWDLELRRVHEYWAKNPEQT